jgi:hypothetical protein
MVPSKLAGGVLAAALIVFLPAAPADAFFSGQINTWVSSYGDDANTASNCVAAHPCKTFSAALSVTGSFGVISCLTPVNGFDVTIDRDVTIDCKGMYASATAEFVGTNAILINAAGIHVVLRDLDIQTPFANTNGGIVVTQPNVDLLLERCRVEGNWTTPGTAISYQAGGRLTIRDSLIHDNTADGIDLIPSGGNLEVAIQNTTITGNSTGVLVKPTSGGTVYATFDRVTITQNSGGGLKSDTTSGGVTLDITDSTISNNGGNGINALAGGSQNIVSIKSSVIARNGGAGVQANGANAGVLVSTTLLDQNAAGATSIVGGGNMFTYGNNNVVGSLGAGFNATATLH